MSVRDALCWDCEHLYWSAGERDWSDVTPGSDWYMECTKRQFAPLHGREIELADFRAALETARTCPLFVARTRAS